MTIKRSVPIQSESESVGAANPIVSLRPIVEAAWQRRAQLSICGVPATRAALALAQQYDVSMPIVEQAHAVLFEGRDPRDAMTELMSRDPTAERWGRVP